MKIEADDIAERLSIMTAGGGFLERLSGIAAMQKTLEEFPPARETAGAWREFLESAGPLDAASRALAERAIGAAAGLGKTKEKAIEAAGGDSVLRRLRSMREMFAGGA